MIRNYDSLAKRLDSDGLDYCGLDAGKIVRAAAQHIGGGGGGRPTLAQAGGKDASRLGDALEAVKQIVGETVQ